MPRPTDISTVRKPGPNPPGRRCAEPGCITVLSRWNPRDKCCAHAEAETAGWTEYRDDLADLMQQAA